MRDREGISQEQLAARLRRLAGANLADGVRGIDDAFEHDLDLAAAFLDAEEARLDHPGIVEDEQVARLEQARQVGEPAVDMLRAADVQQAAAGALGRRVLGDQFGREGKVEVVDGQRHGLRSIWFLINKIGFPRRKAVFVVTGAPSQTRTGTPFGGGF